MSEKESVEIGPGKNGEVYPCPDCGRHETVRWLPGDQYRYECDECYVVFTPGDLDE